MTEKKKQTAVTPLEESEHSAAVLMPRVLAPINDRFDYERQMNGLPSDSRDVCIEATRLADLCRYFSERDMQVPPHICREIVKLRELAVPERADRMVEISEELMEYLHNVSEDCQFRM